MMNTVLESSSLMVKCLGCEVRQPRLLSQLCYLTLSFPVYNMWGMIVATPRATLSTIKAFKEAIKHLNRT